MIQDILDYQKCVNLGCLGKSHVIFRSFSFVNTAQHQALSMSETKSDIKMTLKCWKQNYIEVRK